AGASAFGRLQTIQRHSNVHVGLVVELLELCTNDLGRGADVFRLADGQDDLAQLHKLADLRSAGARIDEFADTFSPGAQWNVDIVVELLDRRAGGGGCRILERADPFGGRVAA